MYKVFVGHAAWQVKDGRLALLDDSATRVWGPNRPVKWIEPPTVVGQGGVAKYQIRGYNAVLEIGPIERIIWSD